jgi:hypothetical protein
MREPPGFSDGQTAFLSYPQEPMTASRLGSGMDSILANEIARLDGGGAAAAGGAALGAAVAVVFAFFGFASAGGSAFGVVALTAVLQAGEWVAT